MKRIHSAFFCLAVLFFCFSVAYGQPAEIRILYVNDFHGFAEPHKLLGAEDPMGGASFLAARVRFLREQKPTLVLSAGDMIQGSNWANLFQGRSVIELMDLMRFDAMVVGNHEFDFGQEILQARISEAAFPVLGANVDGFPSLKPYVIQELQGIRIAIIGVVTEETPRATHPKNVAGLKFSPPASAIRQWLNELKGKADIFLILSHIGHEADRKLAENIKDLDIIIGGHSHTKVLSPVRIGNTLVVQAWEHGKALGILDLAVENGRIADFKGYLEEIRPGMWQGEPAVAALVKEYRDKVESVLNEELGTAQKDLDGQNVRLCETDFGNLVADIIRQRAGADIAVINGGGIRTTIKKGIVRKRDVYDAVPFDNYILGFRIAGKRIREMLEHSVSAVERGDGRFLQISGLSFVYNRSASPGSRVQSVLISGRPLEPEKEYTLATIDFLAAGGNGYGMLADCAATNLVFSDSSKWLKDVVVEHIKKTGIVSSTLDRRITEAP